MKQHAACHCPFPAVGRPTVWPVARKVYGIRPLAPCRRVRPSGPTRAEAVPTPDGRPVLRLDLRHVQTRLVKIEASWCRLPISELCAPSRHVFVGRRRRSRCPLKIARKRDQDGFQARQVCWQLSRESLLPSSDGHPPGGVWRKPLGHAMANGRRESRLVWW